MHLSFLITNGLKFEEMGWETGKEGGSAVAGASLLEKTYLALSADVGSLHLACGVGIKVPTWSHLPA